jgi:hypothetical protein
VRSSSTPGGRGGSPMTNDTIIDVLEIREMRREELTFALDLAAVCWTHVHRRTHASMHTCLLLLH